MSKRVGSVALLTLVSMGVLGGCMPAEKEMAPLDDKPLEENIHNIKDDERDIKGEDGTYLGNLDIKNG